MRNPGRHPALVTRTVLRWLMEYGPATVVEIAAGTGIEPRLVQYTLQDNHEENHLRWFCRVGTRPARCGRHAVVWSAWEE